MPIGAPGSVTHQEIPEIHLPPGVESQDSEDWEGEGGGKGKVRLVRSHAIRDSASPPPPGHAVPPPGPVSEVGSERSIGSDVCDGVEGPGNDTVSVTDSGRGDTDTPEGEIYTDSTGTDLTQFIINTLNKNSKDRVLMLKLEQEMSSLVKDPKKTHHKFPHMSSYHRMLVHRVAAYFGLDHNVDQSGNCVIVNKTKNTRLPEMKFRDHIAVGEEGNGTGGSEQQPLKLKLMKRESCSCDSGDRQSDASSRRSKSIEEREEEYEKARRRIFNEMMRGDKTGVTADRLVMHSDQRLHCLASTKGANQARSFDIRESLTGPADRPAVSKSFSFGGYPAPQHLEPRKQAPSPHQYRASPPALLKGQVVWAVSDVSTVPPGSVLINPDSGTPYLNSDGSVYLFDPGNPPRLDPHAPPYHGHATPPTHPGLATPPQDLVGGACDLSKLQLDVDQVSVGSMGSHTSVTSNPSQPMFPQQWMVQGSPAISRLPTPPQHAPTPYILVNPVSSVPLPQYIPYLSQPAPMATPPRPLLFSIHRSPPHSLVLFLQHCPSVLTRAQLTSFLDSFLGPAAPQLHGGQWQFLDQAGVWGDLSNLPPDTPTTNRFPIQIYFELEEQASNTVQALKNVGFLPMEQNQD